MTPPAGSRDTRICFIGDSFVNGTADPDCLGWVGRVAAEQRRRGRDLTVYNLGIRRDTSADVRRRWRGEAEARLPVDVDGRLVFSFGVNDCNTEGEAPRLALAATLDHAARILADASRWRPTLFVGPPPIANAAVNGRLAALSPELAKLCAGLGIPYLDTLLPLLGSAAWMREVAGGDGAHPGAAGYAELASRVSGWDAWHRWF